MDSDFLYHYTSLQALALILKSKTIKFNSLANMDDMEETISRGIVNGGKYCFVSSWTEDDSESIAMWDLYSRLSGVRVKMRKYPFVEYKWNDPLYPEQEIKSYFSLEQLYKYDIFPHLTEHDILYKVEYTRDENKIFPDLKRYVEAGYHIDYEKLGKSKRDTWAFQKEWRYILYIRPVKLSDFIKSIEYGKSRYKHNIIASADLPITEIYLNVNLECLSDMEIMCGPKMSEGDRVLLECLVDKYAPNAKIIESCLKIH